MKKRSFCSLLVVLGLLFAVLPPLKAQLVLGQYEDEAPFRTWNTFGVQTAPASGQGGAHFAVASDASATVINPALLPSLSKVSFTLSGTYTAASLFRYSIVNTGVLFSQDNSSMGIFAADFLGFSVSLKGWALGFSIGLLETYDRPHQNPVYEFQGQILYDIDFKQEGFIRNYNLSLAKNFGGWLSVGIGANYISGRIEKKIIENYFYNGISIRDEKSHDFDGFYINGGVVIEATKYLTLAVVVRTPFTKEADSRSLLRYDSSQGNTKIDLEASARNTYQQPLVVGAGMNYKISKTLAVALDISYFDWSSYAVNYYEEELDRDFKNIVKIGGGIQYSAKVHLFRQDFELPLRAGVSYDPQPMKNPSSYYLYFTFGAGIRWKGFHMDAGAMLGTEKGSGDGLFGRKFTLTLSYLL